MPVIVDDILLREPNLVTPYSKPVGPVTTKDEWSAWFLGSTHPVGSRTRNASLFSGASFIRNDLSLNGTSDYATIPNTGDYFTNGASGAFSFIFDFVSGGTQSNYARLLDCKDAWGGLVGWTIEAGTTSTSLNILLSKSISSVIDIGTGLRVAGARVTLVGVFAGGTTTLRIYRDGVYKGQSISFQINATTMDLFVGRYAQSATNPLNGDVKMFAFRHGAISEAEAKALSRDPYQFLIPA